MRHTSNIGTSNYASNIAPTTSTALFKYKPSHIIFNEMCMVLQSRAFYVTPDDVYNKIHIGEHYAQGNIVQEIGMDVYNPDDPSHFLVHDIAFNHPGVEEVGANGMGNEIRHQRALWFHIEQKDIYECSLQERMAFKRTTKKLAKIKEALKRIQPNDNGNTHLCPKSFDVYKNVLVENPIIMNLPLDKDMFDLTTEVLNHHLYILKGRMCHNQNEKEEFHSYQKLRANFESLQLHLSTFCFWPINDGREIIDKTTLVPDVDNSYVVPSNEKENDFAFHNNIWKSFAQSVSDDKMRINL